MRDHVGYISRSTWQAVVDAISSSYNIWHVMRSSAEVHSVYVVARLPVVCISCSVYSRAAGSRR